MSKAMTGDCSSVANNGRSLEPLILKGNQFSIKLDEGPIPDEA